MFRALICPSSGVCDYVVDPTTLAVSFLICCVLELGCSSARVVSRLAEPHHNSNTQIKNETANVAVKQHSRKLLKMGILIPETC